MTDVHKVSPELMVQGFGLALIWTGGYGLELGEAVGDDDGDDDGEGLEIRESDFAKVDANT